MRVLRPKLVIICATRAGVNFGVLASFTVALLPNVLLINKNHTLTLILIRKYFLLLLIALLNYIGVETTLDRIT